MERVGRVMVAARIAGGPRILATGALWHAPSGAASAPTAGPKAIAHIRAAAGRQVSRGWLEGAAVSPVQRPAESATAAPQAWRLIQSRHRSHGRAGSARGAHDQAMMEFAKQNEQQLTLTELINFGKNADRSSPILCNLTLVRKPEFPVEFSARGCTLRASIVCRVPRSTQASTGDSLSSQRRAREYRFTHSIALLANTIGGERMWRGRVVHVMAHRSEAGRLSFRGKSV